MPKRPGANEPPFDIDADLREIVSKHPILSQGTYHIHGGVLYPADKASSALILDFRQSNRPNPLNENECEICGEPADDEMGEFWDYKKQDSVYAHAQCGLDANLPMA